MIGTALKLSIFGQSHSEAIGAVLDGLPAGEAIDLRAVQAFLNRRAPGARQMPGGQYATARREADKPLVLSGLAEGRTCGAPLAVMIRNTDARPGDYGNLRDTPRPSHADYPAAVKYGPAHDIRGGGHFSGRLTAPLCFAGAVCGQILERKGITTGAHIASIGKVEDTRFDPVDLRPETLRQVSSEPFAVLDLARGEAMRAEIAAAREAGDSVGGVVECAVLGLPPGLGEPMFEGIENKIAQLVFGIPAVKGIEFGAGFAVGARRGSENNDAYEMVDGQVRTRTNHGGGIAGGLSSGMPLVFRAAFKPTPSIAMEQDTVSLSRGENTTLQITGRHDPCIVPRAVPCVEAAAMVAVLDLLLMGNL